MKKYLILEIFAALALVAWLIAWMFFGHNSEEPALDTTASIKSSLRESMLSPLRRIGLQNLRSSVQDQNAKIGIMTFEDFRLSEKKKNEFLIELINNVFGLVGGG